MGLKGESTGRARSDRCWAPSAAERGCSPGVEGEVGAGAIEFVWESILQSVCTDASTDTALVGAADLLVGDREGEKEESGRLWGAGEASEGFEAEQRIGKSERESAGEVRSESLVFLVERGVEFEGSAAREPVGCVGGLGSACCSDAPPEGLRGFPRPRADWLGLVRGPWVG